MSRGATECRDCWPRASRAPVTDASPMVLASTAAKQASKVFGPAAEVATEADIDPETGTSRIFVVIRTALALDAAEQLLKSFEQSWWTARMPVDGSVAVELRFV